jgi:hypothetical protein
MPRAGPRVNFGANPRAVWPQLLVKSTSLQRFDPTPPVRDAYARGSAFLTELACHRTARSSNAPQRFHDVAGKPKALAHSSMTRGEKNRSVNH